MFKKLLLGLGIAGFLGLGSIAIVNGQSNFDDTSGFGTNPGNTAGVGVVGEGQDTGGGLIDVIKSFINWVLGLLSLIALVILLYGGFKMVTAAGDEGKYKEGFKILKQAGIGLAVIGLSWFVVSIIFWIIGGVT
ncbi:MAG TPA: pilin, partial [Candidatus Absconditabacterales bacterium]|nr:pilin [Candidatus Absconditabacterales bacterium]